MKSVQILFAFLLFFLPFLGANDVQAQDYTGTFQVETGGVTLTLTIQQDANNQLTGTLKRSNESVFSLQGMVDEGAAAGVISGSEGSFFFEAYVDGDDLTLSLIEPDQFNMPNYDSAEYLVFSRSNQQSQLHQAPVAVQPPSNPPPPIKPGSEQLRDAINGYSFTVPEGWVHQKADGQILMGSHTIPGIISVSPHQARSMQELQGLMSQGLQEEGIYLTPDGAFQQRYQNMASGYYKGSVQGEQARGYLIGVLSPHGGGLYILALSTPEKLGQSEASYSGDLSGGGNWGVASQDSNRGRWTIQGTIDSGVITVISPDGTQTRYEYHVFIERGEKYYREYKFNGYLYQKQKNF